ncbi:MAG: hypothetical protein IJ740_13430 [Ruminococcus sp.]|nr:hypothetical protein [Ruminococcus sp.]
MAYEVIKLFTDLKDNNYLYNVGDTYPREGYKPTNERIDELLGSGNKQGTPLIKARQETAESVTEGIDDKAEGEPETKPKKTRKKAEN